jgi:DNA-binding SARP family transcriptional activator
VNTLSVFLFGQFRVQCDEEVLTDLFSPKLQKLFCYLLLHRDRSHPREALASLLWGNSSTAQSKKYLRQALWQIQGSLESENRGWSWHPLLTEADSVRLNPDEDLWLDVAVFERACARTQGMSGAALDAQQVQILQDAADLYGGDLLEGWFQDWCLYERERFQNMYLALLDKLMDYCEAHNEYESGLDFGTRILRYDGARERTHRRLMRLYYFAGDRTASLRQYDRCVRALRLELAVKPATRTVTLYQQIRTERFPRPTQSPLSAPASGSPSSSSWPEMVEQLQHLQETLARVQDELQRAVDAAERAMRD